MLTAGLSGNARAANAPSVVVTIKPVHAIVGAVMDGVGEPDLLLPDNASPHGYALKPSDARALGNADLVVWVGEALEAFLHDALENLAADARVIELVGIDGMKLLPTREGGIWDVHDHGHDDHAHDNHDDHGHDDHAHDTHDDHGHDEHAHDDHAHEHHAGDGINPHLWLDLGNARLIASAVADSLAAIDPVNGALYSDNAARYGDRLDSLDAEIRAALEPVRDAPFIVFHDAYQYLETRYGLMARGSITIDPDRSPSAKRIAELRHVIEERDADCVFSEPQFTPKIVQTLVEGTDAGTGSLDSIGVGIEPGPGAYEAMMRRNVAEIVSCLGDE